MGKFRPTVPIFGSTRTILDARNAVIATHPVISSKATSAYRRISESIECFSAAWLHRGSKFVLQALTLLHALFVLLRPTRRIHIYNDGRLDDRNVVARHNSLHPFEGSYNYKASFGIITLVFKMSTSLVPTLGMYDGVLSNNTGNGQQYVNTSSGTFVHYQGSGNPTFNFYCSGSSLKLKSNLLRPTKSNVELKSRPAALPSQQLKITNNHSTLRRTPATRSKSETSKIPSIVLPEAELPSDDLMTPVRAHIPTSTSQIDLRGFSEAMIGLYSDTPTSDDEVGDLPPLPPRSISPASAESTGSPLTPVEDDVEEVVVRQLTREDSWELKTGIPKLSKTDGFLAVFGGVFLPSLGTMMFSKDAKVINVNTEKHNADVKAG